jgi:hypothetical protein
MGESGFSSPLEAVRREDGATSEKDSSCISDRWEIGDVT